MYRRFGLIIVAALIAAGSLAPALAVTAVEKHGALKTQGGYLLNKNNKIVQLRGMSYYWSNPSWIGWSYYNNADATVKFLVDNWKCTVIRIAYDRDGGNNNGGDGVQKVIDACLKYGIYVIIDWHSHDAHTTGGSTAVNYFKEQATKYKDKPNVIFEPFNEPINVDRSDKDGSQVKATAFWKTIKPYLANVTEAVRSTGSQNLVILGTPYFCQFVNVVADDPVLDKSNKEFSNVAYAFHFYAASHGPESYYVKESGKGGMESSYLDGALGVIPIFVSEWGTTHSDGGQQIDEANTNWWFKQYLNGKFHLSSCNWSVSSGESSSAFSSGTSPSASGNIVKRLLTAESTDEYNLPSADGNPGPGGTTVFAMPATHPAAKFNKYWGGNVSAAQIPFLDWDDRDKRTSKDSCVKVLPGSTTDWVSYSFKSSAATTKMVIRYLAKAGTGSIDVSVDNVSVGKVTIAKGAAWTSAIIDAPVATGDHTVKLTFTDSKEGGFLVEWIELTSNPVVITGGIVRGQIISTEPVTFSAAGQAIQMTLPERHDFNSYRIFDSNGRVLRTGSLVNNAKIQTVENVAQGMWLVELSGKTMHATGRVLVSGK